MPPSKKQALVKKSTAIAAKPGKKHTPPSPPEDPHHEKPHKPGKKHPKQDGDKPAGKHLRRAFEHLGRVEALQTLAHGEAIASLVRLAQTSIDNDDARPTADLLRAAEHLSFAAIAARDKAAPSISPALEQALRKEFRKLLEHAEDHDLPRDSTLGQLLRDTLDDARTAFEASSFRQALELARAAEALATINHHQLHKLDAGEPEPSKPKLPATKHKD